MSDERVTTAVLVPEDEDFDGSLRPRSPMELTVCGGR